MGNNFVFYSSWLELLNALPEEKAKELAYQIILLGTGVEITTTDPLLLGILNGAIAPSIDAAKKRYEKAKEDGRKGGRPQKEFDELEMLRLYHEGVSYRAIGEKLGVSKDTVARRINKIKQLKEEPQ